MTVADSIQPRIQPTLWEGNNNETLLVTWRSVNLPVIRVTYYHSQRVLASTYLDWEEHSITRLGGAF